MWLRISFAVTFIFAIVFRRVISRKDVDVKRMIFLISLLFSQQLFAAGFTNWAVPTEIRTINTGILILGSFGNPGGCANDIGIVVKNDTNEYNLIKSSALAALVAQREMRFYVVSCENAYDNYDLNVAYQSRNASIR